MPVSTDFSSYDGEAAVKLRKAALDHQERAVIEAALALKPKDLAHDPSPHSIAFSEHSQAAQTLREVAALLAQETGN